MKKMIKGKKVLRLALMCLMCLGGLLHGQTEAFYLKALRDGKTCLLEGRYEQAIEHFKIAEFGLKKKKKDPLAELYLYYSLSCYKLNRPNQARKFLDTLENELGTPPESLPAPPQVKRDLRFMLSALGKYHVRPTAKTVGNPDLQTIDRFEQEFLKALEHLENDRLKALEKQTRQLKRIDKNDVRITFLEGARAFKQKKYGKCIDYLKKITSRIPPDYRDETYYYLSFSYYVENDRRQARHYYDQITAQRFRRALESVLKNAPANGNFDALFQDTLEILNGSGSGNLTGQVKKNLAQLERMDNHDGRVFYLKGLLAFQAKKYNASIEQLDQAARRIGPKHREAVYYYLVLSYYFTQNYHFALQANEKIQTPGNRQKLAFIIDKINGERTAYIQHLSRQFSNQVFKRLIARFPGDQSLSAEILSSAIKTNAGSAAITRIIDGCGKKNQAYDPAFILMAAEYLENQEKVRPAIDLIESSRFYNAQDPEHIDIYYRLGLLYVRTRELKKALAQMKKVTSIQEDYKDADEMIEQIRTLINGKRRRRP
jgi:tetratricopeptide (TPR) repeat protein